MIDFVEAVKRPWKTDPITIVLGTLFAVFAPLRPLLHGLGVESARRPQSGNETMPHFSDFVDMYLSGLLVIVTGVLFFVPALIVLLLGALITIPLVWNIFMSMAQNPILSVQSFIGLLVNGAVFGALALILTFFAMLMAPIGIQLFAHDKKIGSAFQLSKIWKVISMSDYWITWLLLMAYGVVLVGVVAILSIPSFNALSGLFMGAAAYTWWMTSYIMFAEVVKDSGVLHGHAVHHTTSAKHVPAKRSFAKKKKK
jgi:fumarate reductase subunit C